MSELLKALRSKFKSPQECVEALGLDPAAVLDAQARYRLAADAKTVTDKATGRTYPVATFARALWSTKEDVMYTQLQRRLAQDADLPSKAGIAGDPKTLIKDQGIQSRHGIATQLDQDPDDGPTGAAAAPPDPEETVQFLRIILQKSADPQALLEAIAAFVTEQGSGGGLSGDGVLPNNKGALDRKRGAKDSRRPAQDSIAVRSLNHKSFLSRFPDAAKIDAWR